MTKLPLKTITIIVCTAIVTIFIYQAYWLYSLVSQAERQDTCIAEALRISDYNEIVIRIAQLSVSKDERKHGSISLSTGYKMDKDRTLKSVGMQTVVSRKDIDEVVIHDNDWVDTFQIQKKDMGEKRNIHIEVKSTRTNKTPQSAVTDNQNMFATIINNEKMLSDLMLMMQQGIHNGIDMIQEPDINILDSLFTAHISSHLIDTRHRLEQLHFLKTADGIDSTKADTINVVSSDEYTPSKRALCYDYCYNTAEHSIYRVWMEPVGLGVFMRFKGILVSSLITLILLAFSFWYLIHILLKQKTLDEMKTDFTHNITHELKTPISVAYAANDALFNFKQGEDAATREKYLRISQEQLRKLKGMVEQILSASMERRKDFTLYKEQLDISKIMTSLIEMQRLKCGKQLSISLDIPEGMTVYADKTHFCQIIDNMLDNAVKYSHDNADVTITCATAHDGTSKISITDRGIGISENQQQHIFEKFYRVPNGNRHDVQGYGLGLYYVATMMRQHGGSIVVDSKEGKGSTFTLRFPDT
ncbi:MAG: HAMP domain-containing histidine kinase [Prevotella sp.]|nr:HAMP domain-containing histidine kinase [Prevotella sp.]